MAMVFLILTQQWTQNSITVPATTSRIGTEGLVSANDLGCGVGAEQLATMSMDFFILSRRWTQKKYHRSRNDELIWNRSVSANGLVCGGGAVQLAMMAKNFFYFNPAVDPNKVSPFLRQEVNLKRISQCQRSWLWRSYAFGHDGHDLWSITADLKRFSQCQQSWLWRSYAFGHDGHGLWP
jgi:hypothetical protein